MDSEKAGKRKRIMDEAGVVTRFNRSRWDSVFNHHDPTIREVIEGLGLRLSASSSTTNRGTPKFDNPESRKISREVTKLSKELPKDRKLLLDFAANPLSLKDELENLLGIYGSAIWGKDTDRTTGKTKFKDLYFESTEHQEIIKIQLHRWIILKACYCIRNEKQKRSTIENDAIADGKTVPTQRKRPRKNFSPVPYQQIAGETVLEATSPVNVSPGDFTAVNVVLSAHNTPDGRNYSGAYNPLQSQPLASNPFVPGIKIPTPSAPNLPTASHVVQNVRHVNIAAQSTPAHPPLALYPPSAPYAVFASSSPQINHIIQGLPICSTPPIQSAPSAHPAQKTLKLQPSEVSLSSSDIELLQYKVLGFLMQYLFPKSDTKDNEAALLRNLEYLWILKTPFFQRQMGHLFEVQSKVLMAWVEERRKISQLRSSMENKPAVPASEMVDRLLAMNDLRVLRLKWKTMNTQDGNQTLSHEDLLCRNFAVMTSTGGTEHLFQNGLDRLNDNMFEFMKSEDMKIMLTKR